MILDKIENAHLYKGLGERIATAFAFLEETDLENIEIGKHVIDGDNVFALVQEYDSKNIENAKLEAHKEYIDIQYIISGVEQMGYTTLRDQKITEVREGKDCTFFEGETSMVKVEARMFALFFPEDLHMPGVKFKENSKVRKVVLKIKA